MVNREGSVDGSGSKKGSSKSDRESRTEELMDDCDMYEDVETLEGVRARDDEDSLLMLNERVDGVGTELIDESEREAAAGSMGVSGGKGEAGSPVESTEGVSGMVLSLFTDETADPLGLKNEVSNEVSGPSCKASDITEGEGSS